MVAFVCLPLALLAMAVGLGRLERAIWGESVLDLVDEQDAPEAVVVATVGNGEQLGLAPVRDDIHAVAEVHPQWVMPPRVERATLRSTFPAGTERF